MPKVYVKTYGCQMNVYDSAAIEGILVDAGLCATDDVDEAEVILLNTCSVRDHAEHRATNERLIHLQPDCIWQAAFKTV